MSATSDYYLAQADACSREAEAATLDNVRDRSRRSEQSWRAMAARLQRAETMRADQVAEKALRDAPEELTAEEIAEDELADAALVR